jgi:flavin-dependent dehydrogenase
MAIHSARRGLSTVLFERQSLSVDKACGEGLLPPGLRELEALGARALISPADCSPIAGIRYLQEDGSAVEGRLPAPGGLGIRRIALVTALERVAREAGVEIQDRCAVNEVVRTQEKVRLVTSAGDETEACLLIAADGLASPLRKAQGLELPEPSGSKRYGLRQHFRLPPWTEFVEVHFARGVEAYVTPVGAERVGVAFLWEDGRVGEDRISFRTLLRRFPLLERRLESAPEDSKARGAGPLSRSVRGRVLDRFALLGDAAGYVDAITGEGLSLALRSAAALGALLPDVLARGATQRALGAYERAIHPHYFRYACFTRTLLFMARRPALRIQVIRLLARYPGGFQTIMNWALEP